MIDPISFLILVLLSVGLSHVVFPYDCRNRLFWIVTPGIVLLFIVQPIALALAFGSFAFSICIFLLGKSLKNRRIRSLCPYLNLLLLFVPDLMRISDGSNILWLGSAFFIIRQMMTVAHGIKSDVPFNTFVPALTLATFFFAALPSGPVFNGLRSWEQLRQNEAPVYGEGCYRIFEGFVFLFAIAGILGFASADLELRAVQVAGVGGVTASLVLWFVVKPIVAFGFLFATFYGYSRIAEGSALLFGFEVPQNFNKPHLARDLADFWKRWHRSMAEFVMQYVYLPLLVTTSQAKLALVSAFLFMGLWHNVSSGFLIWGLGHGIGLAYILPWAQQRNIRPSVIRMASLAYVIFLSSTAHGVF